MSSNFSRGLRLTALAFAVVAATFALVACGDDDDNGNGDSNASGHASLITAITTLDNAGLHGMDDAINKDGEVPANARTVVVHMETVTRLTEWPGELKSTADQLAGVFAQLAVELDKDDIDMAKAGELMGQAHDVQHDLSHDTWAYLAKEAGVGSSSGDDHQ
ncbi:MAG: hypothetical protein M0R74_04165 [Dehalococcoidia bacterium]|nr:hypothetical protein [Dehalococcoidia bacterium]